MEENGERKGEKGKGLKANGKGIKGEERVGGWEMKDKEEKREEWSFASTAVLVF